MKLVVLPRDYDGGPLCIVRGSVFHHLAHVRRTTIGARLEGLTADGTPVRLTVQEIGDDHCSLSVEHVANPEEHTRGEDPRIVLFQCIPKGKKLDTIVRQSAETGVSLIVPVQSERSIPRPSDTASKNSRAKHERRRKIVREAIQQSGSAVITEIAEPIAFSRIGDAFAELASGSTGASAVGLFFHEISMQSSGIHVYLKDVPETIALCVGPEGGFSPTEVTTLTDMTFRPVYLGRNVLRTETAALYAVAAVQTVIRERRLWNACNSAEPRD